MALTDVRAGIGGGGGTAGSISFDMGWTIPSPAVADRFLHLPLPTGESVLWAVPHGINPP